MTLRLASGLLVALGLVAPLAPSTAHACGGCFQPVGTPAPVTAHRMAVALSTTETTLWDQIEYSGDPDDFVWVLPIAGTSTVELADQGFFDALQSTTQLTLRAPLPPRTFCSDPCGDSFGGLASADRGVPAADAGAGPSVTIHHEGVVGPYETVTLGSEDPAALVTWLRDHDYQVPDALLPTIEHYVGLHMNFVVLRLRPSTNVQRMQPVRITVPGLGTTFPLRMVAAGVEVSVSLELFVFAESRIEAANFPNSEVDRAAITYDWATGQFDYEARFEDALFAGEGTRTNWVTEWAGVSPSLESFTSYGPDGEMRSAAEDWSVVTRGIPSPYLTRLRTRLPVSELGEDLDLRMSEAGDLSASVIDVTRERNRAPEPECPTYCAAPGITGPGGSTARGRGAGFRCSAGAGGATGVLAIVALGVAALVHARRRW